MDGFTMGWWSYWIRGTLCVSTGFFCISGICLVSGGINKSLAQAPMTKKVIN
tara:strand:- start:2509 stop:2664 length:156 start_codon:yes stop_codon:yes gene_type:complete